MIFKAFAGFLSHFKLGLLFSSLEGLEAAYRKLLETYHAFELQQTRRYSSEIHVVSTVTWQLLPLLLMLGQREKAADVLAALSFRIRRRVRGTMADFLCCGQQGFFMGNAGWREALFKANVCSRQSR